MRFASSPHPTRAKQRQQWFSQGKEEGCVEGQAKLLINLLEIRFGELSDAHQRCILSLSAEEIPPSY